MCSPKEMTPEQVAHLNDLTRDSPETDKVVTSSSEGTIEYSIPMNSNDVVFVIVTRTPENM
jgi:xylan 1,4-beta-xylosidase